MIVIHDRKDCCGCAACVQICPRQCIVMAGDSEGFLYPEVDTDRCVGCGLCDEVCPVLNSGGPEAGSEAYAAVCTDEDIRKGSSSGGIFTLLAEKVTGEGGVVFGVRFDGNWEACHGYAESVEELAAFRGSKYMQSRIGDSYVEAGRFLREGRRVMFTGTPCQIAALKRYLRRDYDNLLTVDIVCHGVPSPGVWRRYLEEEFGGACSVTGVDFRDKTAGGWKRYNVSFRLSGVQADGGTGFYSVPAGENIFMRAFLRDYILRPSCYGCPAKGGRSGSDITIADFWGVQDVLPDFDDDRGCSLVLVHTDKGRDIFCSLGDCRRVETVLQDALAANPSYRSSARLPENRDLFFSMMEEGHSLVDTFRTVTRRPLYRRLADRIIGILRKN